METRITIILVDKGLYIIVYDIFMIILLELCKYTNITTNNIISELLSKFPSRKLFIMNLKMFLSFLSGNQPIIQRTSNKSFLILKRLSNPIQNYSSDAREFYNLP